MDKVEVNDPDLKETIALTIVIGALIIGLVLLLPGAKAAAPWDDSTGSNTLLPQTNAYVSAGYSGNSMTTNGTVNSIANMTSTSGLRPTCNWSFGGWFKRVVDTGGSETMIQRSNATGFTTFFLIVNANDTISSAFDGGVEGATTTFTVGVWTHLAATYDCNTTNATLYINGNWGGSNTVAAATFANRYSEEPTVIGCNAVPPIVNCFNGQIDNLTFYNGTWTPTQVANFYTGTAPPANASYYFESAAAATSTFSCTGETTIITVTQNGTIERNSYNDRAGMTCYQFQLNPTIWNFTSNLTDNSSIQGAVIRGQIVEEGDISVSQGYDIFFIVNDTWTINTRYEYTKLNFGFWRQDYKFNALNGTTLVYSCEATDTTFAGARLGAPNPTTELSFTRHGRYASDSSIEIVMQDAKHGLGNLIACNLPTSIGGGIHFNADTFYTNPLLVLKQDDDQLYIHNVAWYFETLLGIRLQQDRFNEDNAQGCEQEFIFFGICDITNAILTALDFILSLLSTVQDRLISHIPFIGPLIALLLVPLNLFFEAIFIIFNIVFATNAEHGLADVLWMHTIYTLSLGAIIAGFTGNILWLFLTPYYFLKYLCLGFIYTFYAIFIWLPMKTIDLIKTLIPGGN